MGEEVTVIARFSPESVKLLAQLTRNAIDSALERARVRILAIAGQYTPRRTGRLAAQFEVSTTPQHIAMKWDAVDAFGFQYAKVADEGRSGGVDIVPKVKKRLRWWDKTGNLHFATHVTQGAMTGAGYSHTMRLAAKQIVFDELARALREMSP